MNRIFITLALLIAPNMNLLAQDPAWHWGQSFGGNKADNFTEVATDLQGNIYTAGEFKSDTFSIQGSVYINQSGSSTVIAKFDQSGQLLWHSVAKGNSSNAPKAIAFDQSSGILLVAGIFNNDSIRFENTKLVKPLTNAIDIWVVSYDSLGNVAWLKSHGGNFDDYVMDLAINPGISYAIVGEFKSDSLYFNGNTAFNANPGTSDAYLAHFDLGGNHLWTNYGGGQDNDALFVVAFDFSGQIRAGGSFSSSQLDFFGGPIMGNFGNGNVLFVTSFHYTGMNYAAKPMTGAGFDNITSIALDNPGNIYVTGHFTSDTLRADTFKLANAGANSENIFLIKFDSLLTPQWAKSYGGVSIDKGRGVTVTPNGKLGLTGHTSSTFNMDGFAVTNSGGLAEDLLVALFDLDGTIDFATSLGQAASTTHAYGIAADTNGSLIIAGAYNSDTLIVGEGFLANSSNMMLREALLLRGVTKLTASAGHDKTVCGSDSVTLGGLFGVAVSGFPQYSIQWTPPTGLSDPFALRPKASPSVPTSYTLTVIDSAGKTATDMVNISVASIPNVGFIGPDTNTICKGSSLTLFGNGAQSYFWSTGSNSNSITVSPDTFSTYWVEGTSSEGCKNSDTAVVLVNALPKANFSISTNGLMVTLTNSSTNADSYIWDFNDGNTDTTTNATHTYNSQGLHEICLTAVNTCTSDTFCITTDLITNVSAFAENHFNIYPNPSQGSFSFSSESTDGKLFIRDLRGKTIRIIEVKKHEQLVNLESISSGVYFLEYNSGGTSKNAKLVVVD